MATRKQLISEINDILGEAQHDCPHTGKALCDAVDRLIFHKATTNEARGPSDARLPDSTWHAIFLHRLPFSRFTFFASVFGS